MTIYAELAKIAGSCGTYNLSDFTSWESPWKNSLSRLPINNHYSSGVMFANFIDNTVCRKAYEFLAKKYKIIYQDEVRLNRNSGRKGFIVLFNVKKERKAKCVA